MSRDQVPLACRGLDTHHPCEHPVFLRMAAVYDVYVVIFKMLVMLGILKAS